MAPITDAGRRRRRRMSLYLLIVLQILQARRRRLREERLRRARARLERFRRFFQRQRSERAMFVTTLASLVSELAAVGPVARQLWNANSGNGNSAVWWDTNSTWSDDEWLDNVRMSRNTFQFVCEELEEHLRKEATPDARAPIAISKRVGLTLWKMATNADCRSAGALFGIAKNATGKILRQVCEAIVHKLGGQFVHPPTGAELDAVVGHFDAHFGVPQCAGVLDATHVPILAPPGDAAADYRNSGGWHSVVLQVLVDHTFCIMDFQIGHKGSTRDADLFQASSLYAKGQSGHLFPAAKALRLGGVSVPLYVVADGAYPLRDWVMTPFEATDDEDAGDRQDYNRKLGLVHDVAKAAITRLKTRWRCLCTRNDSTVDFLPLLVQACCVMHNVCESLQQPLRPEWLDVKKGNFETPEHEPWASDGDNSSAEQIRDALVRYFIEKETATQNGAGID